jgi:hypothetical protein
MSTPHQPMDEAMTPVTDMEVRRVSGRAFEDILDGYFPLEESVRQMMERQGFASALITLLHAPVMNIKGLAPHDPVPLSLRKTYAGMIDHVSLTVFRTPSGLRLSGVGKWFWLDPSEETAVFPPSIRLGEPAFVRGIGIDATNGTGGSDESGTVAVARLRDAAMPAQALPDAIKILKWKSCRAWGGWPVDHGILSTSSPHQLFGKYVDQAADATEAATQERAGSDDVRNYYIIDTSPDQNDVEALRLARLL